MTNVAFPFQFDAGGRTARPGEGDHIRDLIEQVLFTSPGERINRPNFGTGLMQLVFAPNSSELATAIQFLLQGALQQQLGDLIQVDEIGVESVDATLTVMVRYTVLRTRQSRTEQFERGGAS